MYRGPPQRQDGGNEHGARPHDYQSRPPGVRSTKFEKIAAARRESKAASLKRQVAELDLSPDMASPATLQRRDVIMMNEPHALALSSFDERQWAPRLLLYQAVAGPLREGAAAEPGAATKRVHESGEERGKVLKKTLSRCLSAIPEKRVVVSKQGGTFLCRPDQITLFRPSG